MCKRRPRVMTIIQQSPHRPDGHPKKQKRPPAGMMLRSVMPHSTSVLTAEARIVMDIRRARCSESRSPSPTTSPEVCRSSISPPIADPAKVTTSTAATAAASVTTNKSQENVIMALPKSRTAKGGTTRCYSPKRRQYLFRRECFNGDENDDKNVVGTPCLEQQRGSDTNTKAPTTAGDNRRALVVIEKLCRSPAGWLDMDRMFSSSVDGEKVVMKTRNPPVTLGSDEYEERRRERAARGVVALRQLGQEFGRIDALIKTQQAKMANALIKRVASDRGTTTKGAVAAGPRPRQNEPTSNAMNSNASAQSIKNDDPSRPVTASLHVQGPLERQVPGKGANWGDDGGTRPPFSGRRPWRAGGISPFKCEDKKPLVQSKSGKERRVAATLSSRPPDDDIVAARARIEVEKAVDRACKNLVNRPWRLAGVRLVTDLSIRGGLSRYGRKEKQKKIAALTKRVSVLLRGHESARMEPTCFVNAYRQSTAGGNRPPVQAHDSVGDGKGQIPLLMRLRTHPGHQSKRHPCFSRQPLMKSSTGESVDPASTGGKFLDDDSRECGAECGRVHTAYDLNPSTKIISVNAVGNVIISEDYDDRGCRWWFGDTEVESSDPLHRDESCEVRLLNANVGRNGDGSMRSGLRGDEFYSCATGEVMMEGETQSCSNANAFSSGKRTTCGGETRNASFAAATAGHRVEEDFVDWARWPLSDKLPTPADPLRRQYQREARLDNSPVATSRPVFEFISNVPGALCCDGDRLNTSCTSRSNNAAAQGEGSRRRNSRRTRVCRHGRGSGGSGSCDGGRAASPPRHSKVSEFIVSGRIEKRPRWNSRFWLPTEPTTTDITAGVRRSPSPSRRTRKRYSNDPGSAVNGAPLYVKLSTFARATVGATPSKTKLSELKQRYTLYEIGHERYDAPYRILQSSVTAAGQADEDQSPSSAYSVAENVRTPLINTAIVPLESFPLRDAATGMQHSDVIINAEPGIEVVVSELCTMHRDVSQESRSREQTAEGTIALSCEELGGEAMRPSERARSPGTTGSAKPIPQRRGRSEGVDEERFARGSSCGVVGRNERAAVVPASRGLLIEFVRPSRAPLRHEERTKGITPARQSPDSAKGVGKHEMKSPPSAGTSAPIPTVAGTNNNMSIPFSSRCSRQPVDSSSTNIGSTAAREDRSREFLVLTLGFLRRLVEYSADGERGLHLQTNSNSNGSCTSVQRTNQSNRPDSTADKQFCGVQGGTPRGYWEYSENHSNDKSIENERTAFGVATGRQTSPPPPQPPTPPWCTIASILRQVQAMGDQRDVLHERLHDVLGPTLIGALARLVVRAFRPLSFSTSFSNPCSPRYCGIRNHETFRDSTGQRRASGCSGVNAVFLGSTVRDILWKTGKVPVQDDVDRPKTTIGRCRVGYGNPSRISPPGDIGRVRDVDSDRSRSTPVAMSNNFADDVKTGSDLEVVPDYNGAVIDVENPLEGNRGAGKSLHAHPGSSNVVFHEEAENGQRNNAADDLGMENGSSGGYSMDTFYPEDSSLPEFFPHDHPPDTNEAVTGSCEGCSSAVSCGVDDGGYGNSPYHEDRYIVRAIGEEKIAVTEDREKAREVNYDEWWYPLRDCGRLSVLAEMQRVNSHVHIPGLAEDARAFAGELVRLVGDDIGGTPSSSGGGGTQVLTEGSSGAHHLASAMPTDAERSSAEGVAEGMPLDGVDSSLMIRNCRDDHDLSDGSVGDSSVLTAVHAFSDDNTTQS